MRTRVSVDIMHLAAHAATYNMLIHNVLRRLQRVLGSLNSLVGRCACGAELQTDLILDVLHDVLLHESVEGEVSAVDRAPRDIANKIGGEGEEQEVGELEGLSGRDVDEYKKFEVRHRKTHRHEAERRLRHHIHMDRHRSLIAEERDSSVNINMLRAR